MRTFISTWLERLGTSYWFIPTLMALGAIGLSALTVHLDTTLNASWVRSNSWIWGGGPEGARNVLATIAGSTITVAGVVFSITIVTLTLASSQFGPRLLRNFMDDHGTQAVLGIFVATFLYCLLVLRTIRGTDGTTFVPFLSVTCGIVFAVVSLGFLIYFIHHVPSSILAENLIGRVAGDLRRGIDNLYPEEAGENVSSKTPAPGLPEKFASQAQKILSRESGYIQAIAVDTLFDLAERKDLILRLPLRPGSFVAADALLAEVWPATNAGESIEADVQRAFFFGRTRTPTQDVEYCVDQLVEVAVRALSPGINDPFTAISCLEWLGVGLIHLSGRRIPPPERYDEKGNLRLVVDTTTFAGVADAAFNQIRQFGSKSVAVIVHMLDVITRAGAHIRRAEDRVVLLAHAAKIRNDGMAATANEQDKEDIARRFAEAERSLSHPL